MDISKGNRRAVVQELEKANGIPIGTYQAIVDYTTGWDDASTLMPKDKVISRGGDPNNDLSIYETGANRFAEKLKEMDGNIPKAITAFTRGSTYTNEAFNGLKSFDKKATNDAHAIAIRAIKYDESPQNDIEPEVKELLKIFRI